MACDNPSAYGCCNDHHIYIGFLPDKHQKALRLFISKFIKGATEHGDLETGKKWTKDRLYECIDDNFYTIFELLEHLEEEDL